MAFPCLKARSGPLRYRPPKAGVRSAFCFLQKPKSAPLRALVPNAKQVYGKEKNLSFSRKQYKNLLANYSNPQSHSHY